MEVSMLDFMKLVLAVVPQLPFMVIVKIILDHLFFLPKSLIQLLVMIYLTI
jgi:hypothetical protein